MRAYGTSCDGAIRCITAAPAASPNKRCSANWEYCSFVELSWSNVRESTMKPVGKPDAGNPHVRFDERGWETGRRFGVSARAHPRLYKRPPLGDAAEPDVPRLVSGAVVREPQRRRS